MSEVINQEKLNEGNNIENIIEDINRDLKKLKDTLIFLDDQGKNKKSEIVRNTVDVYEKKIKEIEKEIQTARKAGKTNYLIEKQMIVKDLLDLVKELETVVSKEKPLALNEKYQRKIFKKNVKNNRLSLELVFLNNFNDLSPEFQSNMQEIISGNRDANFILSVYNNPNNKEYLDAIYYQSTQIPELRGELLSIYNDSYISTTNKDEYYYTIPGYAGSGVSRTERVKGGIDIAPTQVTINTLFGKSLELANKGGNKVTQGADERGAPEFISKSLGGIVKLAPLVVTGVIAFKTIKRVFNLIFKSKDRASFGENLLKVLGPGLLLTGLFMDMGKFSKKLKSKVGRDITEYFKVPGEKGKKIDVSKSENLLEAALSTTCPDNIKETIIYPFLGMNVTMGLNYSQIHSVSTFDSNGKIESADYDALQEIVDTTWKNENNYIHQRISSRIKDAKILKEKKGIDIIAKTMSDIDKAEMEMNPQSTTAAYFSQIMGESLEKGEDEIRKAFVENIIDTSSKGKLSEQMGDNKEKIVNKIVDNDEYFRKIKSGERVLSEEGGSIIVKDTKLDKQYHIDIESKYPFKEMVSWDDISDRANKGIKGKLDLVQISSLEKIQLMLTINNIYNKIDRDQKSTFDVNFIGKDIQLNSYGHTIELEYDTKKIEDLSIGFDSIEQLLAAGNLINKIKYLTKNQTQNDPNEQPFVLDGLDGWLGDWSAIEFDNISSSSIRSKSFWKKKMGEDLTLLRGAGGIEQLKKKEGKEALVDYLNKWRNDEVVPTRK